MARLASTTTPPAARDPLVTTMKGLRTLQGFGPIFDDKRPDIAGCDLNSEVAAKNARNMSVSCSFAHCKSHQLLRAPTNALASLTAPPFFVALSASPSASAEREADGDTAPSNFECDDLVLAKRRDGKAWPGRVGPHLTPWPGRRGRTEGTQRLTPSLASLDPLKDHQRGERLICCPQVAASRWRQELRPLLPCGRPVEPPAAPRL